MLTFKSLVFLTRHVSLFLPKSSVLKPARFTHCNMFDNKCAIFLICPNENHQPIKLPHKEAVFVGRSPDTRIVDPRCSRKQVQLTANLKTGDVDVVQLGTNSSALDGIEMIQNKVYTMKPNSTLYVLTGFYPKKLKIKNLEERNDKKVLKTEVGSSNKPDKTRTSSSSSSSSHASSSKKESKSGTKSGTKRPSSGDQNESASKRPKLSENGGKKTSDSCAKLKPQSDDKQMEDVAKKLELLKKSAKDLKTPTKNSTPSMFKTPASTANSKSSTPKAGSSSLSGGKPAEESRWDQYDSLYVYTSKGLESRRKIAAFDIDGTIITTQSGKVFPTHPGDWRLLYHTEIGKKLKKMYEEGYKIVFITNQLGVSRGKTQIADLKVKFCDVVEEIDLPVQILVSTKGGIYRKPCPGMWNFLSEKGNDGIPIELSQSFYVGDAAARVKDWAPKKKKDFSGSDRLFALNIGLDFRTPEEFFLGYPTTTKFTMPPFDPTKLNDKKPLLEPYSAKLISDSPEVILLVGYPASGKTFLVKKYLEPKGYVHVNRDTLGTWQKCVTACKDGLRKGLSVVVDNTNPDVESRARYITAAASLGFPCRCFELTTSKDQARHNERFREITDKSHKAINDMIMNSFKSKFKPPEMAEGFKEIVKVNFVPKFKDPKLEKLYRMFLLDK